MGIKNYSSEYAQQYNWKNEGTISSAQSALTTDKSAALINALATAKRVIVTVDDGTVAQNFRFRCSADADSNVINVYAMRGDDDHYQLVATLTLTGGSQVVSTQVFVDTIVLTASTDVWPTEISINSRANNSVALVSLKTHGYKNFLFIATTLGSAALVVEKARL